MKGSMPHIAALVALSGLLGNAQASPAIGSQVPDVSLLALPLFEPDAPVVAVTVSGAPVLETTRYQPRRSPPSVAPVSESIRYRPRRSHAPTRRGSHGWGAETQLHGGFFEPDRGEAGALIGFRAGPRISSNTSLGFGTDYRWKTESVSEVVGTGMVGGQEVIVNREIARSTSHHIPIMGYVQVDLGGNAPVSPYVGGGVGYQWLILDGDDYTTGERFHATFGNWGWQGWGGVSLRLAPGLRLNGEAFYNGANVHRDIRDVNGDIIRETVDMDGVGARFGLTFGLY